MKFSKGSATVIIIAVLALIIIGGGVWYYLDNKPKACTEEAKLCPDGTAVGRIGPNCEFAECPSGPTETPIAENDVANQPAYLIAAYLQNGKNYIDVDYVEWLHGEASINAQIEDGECVDTNDCHAYPNGYKRNQNSKIRTFDVSSSASIEVSGLIAGVLNAPGQNLSISFQKLEDVVSQLKPYLPNNPPFKESKTFITIDVKDGIVTKIIEPYQE